MGGSIESPPPPNVNISVNTTVSNIIQVDGSDTIQSVSVHEVNDSDDSNVTEYNTDDEIEADVTPISITPTKKPSKRKLKVLSASSLPLVAVLNARSLYNKAENFKIFMKELGVEVGIISETWERDEISLQKLLELQNYKIHSYKRPKVKAKKQPGGACAIIYNESRFRATILDVPVPRGVEACWLLLKPINKMDLIENIAIASIYLSPHSVYKTASVNHIIDTIHLLRSQYDNRINYLIGGDVNRLKIDRILDSYGPLSQVITSATRKSAILECIITDLHTLYQTPECLPPLQVDEGKAGSDSDHNIVLLPPITISSNCKPKKRSVVTRPLQQTGVDKFSQFMYTHRWEEVLGEQDINLKVENFHKTLRSKLDEYLPEKTFKVSYLDKKWMSPQLKNLNRKTKREFHKNRKV